MRLQIAARAPILPAGSLNYRSGNDIPGLPQYGCATCAWADTVKLMAADQNNGDGDAAATVLGRLAATIKARRTAAADTSYTRQLLDAGVPRCAKKFGEEAVEVVIASLHESDDALKGEAADVLYHLLVLLEARGLAIEDVLAALERRMGTSGIDEKASRSRKEG
jgi:phosphoribosyl-ATP pyrophosphohydrolase